jgi:hypothetical protein
VRPRPAPLARALALAGVAAALGACSKDKESLVVVGLSTNRDVKDVQLAVVTVGDVARTYDLNGLMAAAPYTVGVYVPERLSDMTVPVDVSAHGADPCQGLHGSGMVTISSVGSTSNVTVSMMPALLCTTDAGADGGGGAGGKGGAGAGGRGGGGVGGQGGGGTGQGGESGQGGGAGGQGGQGGQGGGSVVYPSLTKCTEYTHNAANNQDCATQSGDVIVTDVAFSPNGRVFVSAGKDRRVKVWTWDGATLTDAQHDLATGGGLAFVAFSPDGSLLAVGSQRGALSLWNTSTWTSTGNLTGPTGDIYGVNFSPDGTEVLAIDTARALSVFSVASMTRTTTVALPNGDTPWALGIAPAWTPTSQVLAIAFASGYGEVLDLMVNGGASPSEFQIAANTTIGSATTVQFSPDGTLMAAGADDGGAGFWAIPFTSATPLDPPLVINSDAVNFLRFSPDGQYLVTAEGALTPSVEIYDVATRHTLASTFVPSHDPVSVTVSPDGKAVAAGEADCGQIIVCAD